MAEEVKLDIPEEPAPVAAATSPAVVVMSGKPPPVPKQKRAQTPAATVPKKPRVEETVEPKKPSVAECSDEEFIAMLQRARDPLEEHFGA